MPDGLIFLALAVGVPLAAIAQHEYAARRRQRTALRRMRQRVDARQWIDEEYDR